jgi:hypothetical protein
MTRRWLVAVVCNRSNASTTTSTAESKPNVVAVASRSLSIVFGFGFGSGPAHTLTPLSVAKGEATIRVHSDPLTHRDGVFSSYE